MIALSPACARAGADDIRAWMDHGEWKRARVAVTALERSAPDDPVTLVLGSRVRAAFGDLAGAVSLAERGVARASGDAAAHYQLAVASGMLARRSGKLRQISLGRRFKSESELAVRLDPKQMDARDALIEFHLVAPALFGGHRDVATRLAEEIVAIDPARGRLAQAKCALRDGDSTQAATRFTEALAADPNRYEAHTAFAQFLGARGPEHWDAALEQGRRAIELDSTRATAHAVVAALLAHRGRWPELDQALARAAACVPENLLAFHQAARVLLLDQREPARAERYLRRYLAQEPEGFAPDAGSAHWRLGQALERLDRRPEAIAEMETALKLRPDLDDARKDLKRLHRG